MDERVSLCNYSETADRRRVTFKLVSSTPSSAIRQEPRRPISDCPTSITDSEDKPNWCCRICIMLLLIQVFLLGVILPVHLQHADYQTPEFNEIDEFSHDKDNFGSQYHHFDGNGVIDDPTYVNPFAATAADNTDDDVSEASEESEESNELSEGENSLDNASPPEDDIHVEQHIVEPATLDDHAPTHSNDEDSNDEESSSQASHSCQGSLDTDQIQEKLDSLMLAVTNMNNGISKMETLIQGTIVDERLSKCLAAIATDNQTLAMKYWNQMLQYQNTPAKKSNLLKQVIKESYGGQEDNIIPVIKFIEKTKLFHGYSALYEEMSNYEAIYGHKGVFTLAHYVKKYCGRKSSLFETFPQAVKAIYSNFFTLQNTFNKGFLYYAKRCVARHYYYCLDVVTKRIGAGAIESLENDEKRRFHWKINATDEEANNFFILNQDSYWTYRLQDINNSPRFKMEEFGSAFEIEWSYFQLELRNDDEIAIRVRDTNIFLEGEEFKFDNTTEELIDSFYKTDKVKESHRVYWLVKPVDGDEDNGEDDHSEHENCVEENV